MVALSFAKDRVKARVYWTLQRVPGFNRLPSCSPLLKGNPLQG
jgi:hypothetical protein